MVFQQEGPLPSVTAILWDLRIDPKTGRSISKPGKLSNWFGFVPWYLSASRDGSRFAMTKARDWYDIYLAKLLRGAGQIGQPKRFSTGENLDFPSDWYSDSKTLLFTSNRNQKVQAFRQQLDRDSPELVIAGSTDWTLGTVGFSPDGAWILYWVLKSGPPSAQLMKMPASGGAPEALLDVPGSWEGTWDCPRHPGASCVLSSAERGQVVFSALDVDHGLGKELARTKSSGDLDADLSPDGKRLAIFSTDQLPGKIRFLDLIKRTEREISIPYGEAVGSLAWAADGKSLFAVVRHAGRYELVDIMLDGSLHTLWDAGNHEITDLTSSPDGRYLAFSRRSLENDVWLLDNSPARSPN